MKNEFTSVEHYIESFSEETQEKLRAIRKIIIDNTPGAVEEISYGMPTYKTYKKPLVYFAGFTNHIGFYATPTGHSEFWSELKVYKQGKGSVQFPLNQLIPYDLIKRIVQFRVAENRTKYAK